MMDNDEDEQVPEIMVATGDKFFQCLEQNLKTSIPQYVKNILMMNGFVNAFMMSKLVESKISEIEDFMRHDFAEFMISTSEKINDYLGVYVNCQQKFKFLCGHRTLLEVMADMCKPYYPPISTKNVLTKPPNGNIDEKSKEEIFQKLYDGVTIWLKGQGKFEQVLQFELSFIVDCEATADEVLYSMKCPVPSCVVVKSFSVIWKAYTRKKKSGDEVLCQPRWFFCSLKNHFLKYHLDQENGIEVTEASDFLESLSSNEMEVPNSFEAVPRELSYLLSKGNGIQVSESSGSLPRSPMNIEMPSTSDPSRNVEMRDWDSSNTPEIEHICGSKIEVKKISRGGKIGYNPVKSKESCYAGPAKRLRK